MSRSRDIQRLFDGIVRLRRAGRELPRNRDLAAVRSQLEAELGPTVTRSQAARLLGVSHTALQRWEKSGDLPLVVTPTGRLEIPVPFLVRLHEDVEEQRRSGRRHALESVLDEGRRRAASLDARRLAGSKPESVGLDRHELSQRRSLAYHQVLAERLTGQQVTEALHQVWQWLDAGKLASEYAARWEQILNGTTAEVRDFITADTEEARDLRQSSPFAGMLSEPERRKIIESVR